MITIRLSVPVPRNLRFETAETFVFNGYEVELYANQGETFLGKVGVDANDLNLNIDVFVPLAAPVANGQHRNDDGVGTSMDEDRDRGYFEQLEEPVDLGRPMPRT